jgi:NAD(P)-dependent dehydrogenase (short-subunit alcohol dehydrogenase family)
MKLENKVVILTGATQGIGRAAAFELARAGCRLALAARNAHMLAALAAELGQLGAEAVAIPTDMGDTAQARALAGKTVDAFGKIDVVVNNAGIGVSSPVLCLNEAEARRAMDVNYFGPVALIQAAAPCLKANPDGGVIVNVSSIVGWRAVPGIGGYCATKGALDNLTETLRVELAPDNIRVSAIYPGLTVTNFSRNSLGHVPANRRLTVKGVPSERVGKTIVRAIRTERRDVFVTLLDRAFVIASLAWPWLMDRFMGLYLRVLQRRQTTDR